MGLGLLIPPKFPPVADICRVSVSGGVGRVGVRVFLKEWEEERYEV